MSPGKDFSGPFQNSIFMIGVDTHSKWLEMFCLSQITTQATVTRLRRLFTSYGLQIVTDKATSFMSGEFQTFGKYKGIQHTTRATGHLASNELAERYVQTFKAVMKKLPEH